jgi:hypothetical protein
MGYLPLLIALFIALLLKPFAERHGSGDSARRLLSDGSFCDAYVRIPF